jgi:hypothetical protein
MGCLRGCLVLALLGAVCIGFVGVQISPAVSELGGIVCSGRIEVEQLGGRRGPAVWCVNEQTGRRHSIKALTVIIASAAFFIVFAIPTVMIAVHMDRIGARTNQIIAQREAGALRTDAIVVAVELGLHSDAYRGQVELILTFQINDPYRQPYQARTPWMVREDQRQRAEPGQLVRVKVNPAHPQQVFPDVDWAVISDLKAHFN